MLPQRQQLLAAEQRTPDARPIRIVHAQAGIGNDLRELGRFDEAEQSLHEALALLAQIPGSEDIAVRAAITQQLGLTLQLQGRFAEAEAALREALATELGSAAPSSPRLSVARGDLGNQLRLAHRNEEALRELSAANVALREIGAGAQAQQSIVQAYLGEAQLDGGDAVGAEITAGEALATAREALPAAHYRLGTPLFALARVRLAQGKAGAAEPLLREALQVRGQVHPPHDPRMLEVEVALVQALDALDRRSEAQSLRSRIEPLLQPASSAYIAALRARLPP